MSAASMTAFRKCRKGSLAFSVLSVVFLMVLLCMLYPHCADRGEYDYVVTVMFVMLTACCRAIGPICAVRAKRKGESALKLYDDRIEYRQTVFKEEYDKYYFQDMKSVEINGTDAVLSFVNDVSKKIDFNDLDCYMYDFFEEIQARFKAYAEGSSQNTDNGYHGFKSKFHEGKDAITEIAKYIEKISGLFVLLTLLISDLLQSDTPVKSKGFAPDSALTFVLVIGVFAILVIIGVRKEKNSTAK